MMQPHRPIRRRESIGSRPKHVVAVAATALVAVALAVGLSAKAPAAVRGSVTCYGKWRWNVKTLADRPRLTIRHAEVQVSQLWGLESGEALSKSTPRIAGLETTIYTVTGKLMYARRVDDAPDAEGKGGGDLDYHLVIADPKDASKTMIVEFPDPNCTTGATSYRRKQMAAARAAFDLGCHGAPRSSFGNLSGTATITGVGFYDEPHANGRSLHGVELHPVLDFKTSNCWWVP
jgi:hypothetical protein